MNRRSGPAGVLEDVRVVGEVEESGRAAKVIRWTWDGFGWVLLVFGIMIAFEGRQADGVSEAAVGMWMLVLGYYVRRRWRAYVRRRTARLQAESDLRRATLAEFEARRAQAIAVGAPWLVLDRTHFTHGTCTVRHRTFGAAARCRSVF